MVTVRPKHVAITHEFNIVRLCLTAVHIILFNQSYDSVLSPCFVAPITVFYVKGLVFYFIVLSIVP